ncbi:MAG: cytochrome b/b6 domain-containing protein [Planctomycetota bacterium]|nr:MAG: cytochrome b/b6 domain-containing protein [Planctomycetota bacterium]
MFRIVSVIVFLVVLGGICIHCIILAAAKGYQWRPINILKTLVHLFTLLFLEQKLKIVGVLRKLIYLLALLCFVILLITGFYPVLVHGEHLSGYLLMVHATFAPVFAICLAILAVMWAHNCRFSKSDWPWLQRIIHREIVSDEAVTEKQELVQKICFWLIVLLALPVILSIVLSMFPLFGTKGQEFLLNAHRYSTLLLALVAIIHIYLIIRAKMEQ